MNNHDGRNDANERRYCPDCHSEAKLYRDHKETYQCQGTCQGQVMALSVTISKTQLEDLLKK